MSLLRVVGRSLIKQHRPFISSAAPPAWNTTSSFAAPVTMKRFMSTIGDDDDDDDDEDDDFDDEKDDSIVYKSPFAMLTTRLKAVSISSAIVGAFGVPLLIVYYSGDVPAIGQYAVGGSTMLAACGSTVAINFCFAPYLHTLEKIPVDESDAITGEETPTKEGVAGQQANEKFLIKAVWRNFMLMKQETIFDPAVDVTDYKGIRPFCNFMAKGVPMYIHPEILLDDALRTQLLGEEVSKRYSMPKKEKRDNDEDELW